MQAMTMSNALDELRNKKYRILSALVLGWVFGSAVYGFWLVDLFPPTGKRTLLLGLAACAIGAAGYFFLLDRCILPRFSALGWKQKWRMTTWSILAGTILFLAGTHSWLSPSRYFAFLLPPETLEISVRQSADPMDIEILWMNTSLGDVPYDAVTYEGWERRGDRLVLVDLQNNSLRWSGRTGRQATVVISTTTRKGVVDIFWSGQGETLDISSKKSGKITLLHEFDIPFWASGAMVAIFGIINFIVLSLAASLLFAERKDEIWARLEQSVMPASGAETGGGATLTRLDEAILTGILVAAVLLRIFNLDGLPPYTDEYSHLNAAKALVSGSPIRELYQRSLVPVTLPVALSFRLFGMDLWSARLPGVLFNALAVLPLYLLMKRINRPVAVVSCILYATSPWIVAVARNAREYAYYPFYFYWLIYAMFVFIRNFPDRFVVTQYKKVLNPGRILLGAGILSAVAYGLFIDGNSTFKVILLVYPVFGVLLLLRMDLTNKPTRVAIGVILAGFLVALYGLSVNETVSIPRPEFDGYPSIYFLMNPPQQWYFERSAVLAVIGVVGAFPLASKLYRKNFLPAFWVGLLVLYTLFFLFFFDRYIRPRYILSLQFWLIPALSCGLFAFWIWLKSVVSGRNILIATLFLILLSFNPSQTLLPTTYEDTGYMPITQEYHDDVAQAQSFLLDRVRTGDVLISTVYGSYVKFTGVPQFLTIYPFDRRYEDPQGYVYSIIGGHESGWIVLDDRRYKLSTPLPAKTIAVDGKLVEFIGIFAGQYIWHWGVE